MFRCSSIALARRVTLPARPANQKHAVSDPAFSLSTALLLRQATSNALEEASRRSSPRQQILKPLRQLVAHRIRLPVAVLVEPPR